MSQTSSQRDYAISIIRILATASIFLSHVLQYHNHLLAWWFNVGVQIFLVMSGYLYGLRSNRELDDMKFYRKTFPKILLDYYLVIIPVLLMQIISEPGKLSADRIYKILFTYKILDGGQHLWFIPYILLCYLITPFLIRYFRSLQQKNSHLILGFLGILLFNHVLHDTFIKFFNAAWINCYVMGLFFGFCTTMEKGKLKSNFLWIIAFLALTFNAVRIYIIYFSDLYFDGAAGEYFMLFCDVSHALLGCTLFFGLRAILTPVSRAISASPAAAAFLLKTDGGCYDFYLVHHFFIFGSARLMDLTKAPFANVLIALAASLILAILVHRVSGAISSGLLKGAED